MLDHLGEKEAASAIENAVMVVCAKDIRSLSAGKMGYSTEEVGNLVAGYL